MGKLTFIFLIAFIPAAFAGGWEGTAAMALAISGGFLGITYAVGMGLGINELQIMSKEELYQLIATGLLVALLVGGNNVIDGLSGGMGSGGQNLQDTAISVIDDTLTNPTSGMLGIYNSVTTIDNKVAKESSKTMSCSIVSIGYTVSACGGYSMLSTPLSMSGSIVGFAIGELYSMKRLINISKNYAMSLLLPIGIVLRTFKFTRGAGGFLIAVAISMHILIPAGILFNQMLVDTFIAEAGSGYSGGLSTTVEDCDPSSGIGVYGGDQGAQDTLALFRTDLQQVVFSVLVRGTLGPVLALLIMTAGIRALTSLGGAEVDVSALGRFV
jgi:hypothetical protein